MENKKQLIIIPPMSEALSKLNVVLEGVSDEENMEITIIDDLKELTQFLGTTGQCLILASNAKKCATFLQDNKAMLTKYHCKTILFTPKEIPAKTLIKFTKVGLTESILESSPPKTFLYKVKLLLRSIKTAKPQDDSEKTIKSLDAMRALVEEFEKDTKEKTSFEETPASLDSLEKKKMSDSGEVIDYGGTLKGKSKHQDEAIDTNWKSDKKKESLDLIAAEEEKSENPSEDDSNIDMYYRGKQKKNIELFDLDQSTERALKKEDLQEQELEIAKKKSSYADVIEEGSMKQKRLESEEANEDLDLRKKEETIELNLEAAKKKKLDETEEKSKSELLYMDSEATSNEEDKKRKKQTDLDLDNSLKGRLQQNSHPGLTEEESSEEMDYDNSEIDRNKRKKSVQLDLVAAEKQLHKESEEAAGETEPMDDEVDNISTNMIGKEGSVENIETNMITKNKKSLELDVAQKEAKNRNTDSTSSDQADEEVNHDLDNPLGLDITEDSEPEAASENEEVKKEKSRENSSIDLDLQAAESDKLQYDTEKSDDNSNVGLLLDEELASKKKNEATVKTDDKVLNLRTLDNDNLVDADKNMTANGQVEKIDTFYRSGEAKKSEHNWDNLNKKSDTLKLDILKSARAADGTEARAQKDLGEVTIDYRKLKEEFDLMANTSSLKNGVEKISENTPAGKNYDDAGSFRVVELDSKGLDFSINIINAIYDKDIKAKKIFSMLSSELIAQYKCIPIFYKYKLSDKKFTEVFNAYLETNDEALISTDKKEWWLEYKKNTALFEHFQSKSMTHWRCAEVIKDGLPWEDVELPTWAEHELKSKHVELIFPYFDGIDRMGMALVILPEGIDSKTAPGLLMILELARTLFLDTIERYQVKPMTSLFDEPKEPIQEEKKGVLNFFGGLFGKKKAG